jgi:hypothetical protein
VRELEREICALTVRGGHLMEPMHHHRRHKRRANAHFRRG